MLDVLQRIGVHVPSLLAYLANFIILLGLLYIIAYRPFLRIVGERARRIERGLQDADDALRARDEAMEDRQRQLEEARREAARLLAETREKAQAEAAQIAREARLQAQATLERARERIAQEKQQARQNVLSQSAGLVAMAAERVLGQVIDRDLHRRIVQAAIKEIAALPPAAAPPPWPIARGPPPCPWTPRSWLSCSEPWRV